MTLRACLLGQAHTAESRGWSTPVNDSREWMRVLDRGDVLSYQRAFADPARLAEYDLAIVELTPATHRLPAFLKRHAPHLVCVALIEGRVEYVVRSPQEMESLYEFTRCVSDADLVGVLVERTVPYYRLYAREPQRVQWLGVPYPKAWTDSLPFTQGSGDALVIELGSALDSRNGIANVLVVRELQRRYRDVVARVFYCSPRERFMLESMGLRAQLLQPRRWTDYYRLLRDGVFALLCLDDRRTWGRYALDAASARIPFVGSHLSHAGERVGVLTCDPFDTAAAIDHLSRLIEERLSGRDDFYRDVVDRQYAALDEYDAPAARMRMAAALDAAGFGDVARRLEVRAA